MDNYLGEIRMFVGPYAPEGWAFCNGQLLTVSQNQALFSLIGNTYGGDGQTNFQLPDLQCRVPLHAGTGVGLPNIPLAESEGTEVVYLSPAQLPPHTHTLNATSQAGNTNTPTDTIIANTQPPTGTDNEYGLPSTINTTMNNGAISYVGGNTPVNNVQPFFTITFIIATTGNYPTPPQP